MAPGNIFKSHKAAARDAVAYARKQPKDGLKYGGWIYPVQEGGFSYNMASGDPDRMPRRMMDNLKHQYPSNPVASWHIHPWSRTLPIPSEDYSIQNQFSIGDIYNALKY